MTRKKKKSRKKREPKTIMDLVKEYIGNYIQLSKAFNKKKWREYRKYYMRLQRIKQKLHFIPSFKPSIEKPWLSKSENKILNAILKNYAVQEPKTRFFISQISYKYVLRCKRCNYYVIYHDLQGAIELILNHFEKSHEEIPLFEEIEATKMIIPYKLTKFSAFWNTVRVMEYLAKTDNPQSLLDLLVSLEKAEKKRLSIYNKLNTKAENDMLKIYYGLGYAYVHKPKPRRLVKSKLPIGAILNNINYIPNLRAFFSLLRVKRKRKRKQKPNVERLFMKHYLQP